MRNNFEISQGLLKSADTIVSADYARHICPKRTFEQLNPKAKQQKEQQKRNEIVEQRQADKYLEDNANVFEEITISNENLNSFLEINYPRNSKALEIALGYLEWKSVMGQRVSINELKKKIDIELSEKRDLSTEDKIRHHISQLEEKGKSRIEILKFLVLTYENQPSVKNWIENWKNFLALNQYATTKPPDEQRVIQNIIAKADFTKESSFATSLSQVSNSSEICEATKFEIAQKFNAQNITTVGAMDDTLNKIQTRKKDMEKAIDTKKAEKESLKSEIEDIESQLEALPPLDPKREEIEAKLKEKKERLKDTETTIQTLEEERPKNVSFPFREGYSAKLNPNGTRTIEINDLNFSVKLPKNTLFMSRKNMLSINLTFVYRAFSLNGMERIFTPNLKNGVVPDKKNRLFGSRILQQLGYPTNLILSKSNILQLQKDLGKLKQEGLSNTGMEDLAALGIWDFTKQEVDNNRLKSSLVFIRKNRSRDLDFKDILREVPV